MVNAPASLLTGRRVLVTGATGFIGVRLVEKLAGLHGAIVTGVVRSPARTARLTALGVTIRRVDLGHRSGIAEAVRGQDVVINLAHDLGASVRRNVRGLVNLADACSAAGVARLVHTSSIAVYDGWPTADISETSPARAPGSDYKNAKMAMETALSTRASRGQLDSVIVQPTVVYGPSGWLWTDQIVDRLLSGTLILPDPCPGLCNAVYVDDVADALILAASSEHGQAETFVISGATPTTWRAFLEAYERTLGTDAIRYLKLPPTAHRPSDLLSRARSFLGNPLQVANWGPVRSALHGIRRTIGEAAVRRLRAVALGYTRARGPLVYYPTDFELRLYGARGACRIEKAVTRLGYTPAFDLDRGMAQMAAYVKARAMSVGT